MVDVETTETTETSGSPSRGGGGWRLLAAVAVAFLSQTPAVAAQGFPGWLALWDEGQLRWLENENQLSELCPEPATRDRCREEQLRPRLWVVPLRTGPDSAAASVGELIVTAVPGRGLAAAYRSVGASAPASFTPDLYLQDWGYGPYFHQTISRRRGDWFELPAGPWVAPVWIHDPGADERDRVRWIQRGEIVVWGERSWTVVAAEVDALVLRPEQPADMWCGEGDPPPLTEAEPRHVPRSALLDGRGHLTVAMRYPKGC